MASPSWARSEMVAASQPLAVQAALWALAEGGSAVDAAVASDAVLGVTQPFSSGVGGDAFCLVDDGAELAGFNGSGASPSALTREDCLVDGAWHDRSPLTVTVPGVVDAWSQLSARYGRLPLATVLEPARRLAAEGFPAGRWAASMWTEHGTRLPAGQAYRRAAAQGERVVNEQLARTLGQIAAGGADAHYTGEFAARAVAAVAAEGGVLSLDDLAAHRGEWVEPLTGSFRGHDVVELPPNGQGAAVLVALGRRDGEGAGAPDDPATVVALVDATRAGMEAAYRHVADPRVVDVPAFWAARDTVYTAVWAGGMAVSLISSVFMAFGCGLVAAGAPLQNRGLGFSLDPAHPNVVAPRKRPFHTIIPALLRREGRTHTVFGVVGGPMQPQGHVQVVSHLLDHGLDPQAALDRPRTFWLGGDAVAVEAGFAPEAADALEAAGYRVVHGLDSQWFGIGQIVRRHDDGWLEGGSDRRADGLAGGR